MKRPARTADELRAEVTRLTDLSAEYLAFASHAERRYVMLDMQYLIRTLWTALLAERAHIDDL